jgi:outer membrane biosynthesis protein TonB
MKTSLGFAGFLLAVVIVGAQTPTPPPATTTTEPTPETAPKKTPPPPVRITPLPAEKAAQKKADDAKKKADDAKKKEKEEPKIPGVVVERGQKGFMGVEIINGAFKITFYDQKRKKIAPDVARAALRWDAKYKVGQERLVLNPDADGNSLSSPKTIRPPYNFKLFITLVKEATESAEPVGETHVIDFKA